MRLLLSAVAAGLALLPQGLGGAIGIALGSRLYDRIGPRLLVTFGMGAAASDVRHWRRSLTREQQERVMRFRDRAEAGQRLAEQLMVYAGREDVLVLALPRGGVPVAYAVARALGAPLDVFLVRKLGVPDHEELAMGAIATGGVRVLNAELVQQLTIPEELIEAVAAREGRELARRERLYRGDRPAPDPRGRTIVLVDDGLATGATMRAAAIAVRRQHPSGLVVAVPVAAPATCNEFRDQVDEVICTLTPEPFYAVGYWYEDFAQTSDDEVRDLLARAACPQHHTTDAAT